jgi:hypothetical protein
MTLKEFVNRQLPKWQRLLTSPAPTTAWVLDGSVVGAIRRDAKSGVLHCAVEALPEGAVEIGPIGLQAVDRRRLQAVLSSLQGRIEGARRAAVVLPTGWIRAHLLDFDELPRRQTEIDQVVLWRLKKLLPVLPSELRVSTLPSRSPDGTKRLLCMVGVERVLADLESAFSEVGVEPGLLTPRLFALAHGRDAGSEILTQQESGFLSLLLVVEGAPQLLRTKPLTAGMEASTSVGRELRLASSFIRDDLGVADGVSVTISAESDDADQALRTWWSDQNWVRIESEAAALPFVNQEEAEKLGWARIAPVLGLIEGAAP